MIECFNEAESKLLKEQFLEEVKYMKRSSNSNAGCKCFPLCTTITYEAETSESEDGYTFYEYMLRKQNNSLQSR